MVTLNSGMYDAHSQPLAEAVLDLLLPAWQTIIGVCVLIAVVTAGVRIARRGRSRMGTLMAVFGVAIVGVAVLGFLFGG
jgi:threonine/homoserine/homoserine lactone efflux protein